MYQDNDDNDIPNEQSIYSSFQSENEQIKLQYLANCQSNYENQHIVYLTRYFMEFDLRKINIQSMNSLACCLSKFTEEQKSWNPNLITKILAHIKTPLQQSQIINELHNAFLESCIKSYNYKIGYQFIKSKIFLIGTLEKKNQIIIEYFYLSGLIADAEKDFEEALRCYKIAYKFHPINGFSTEAQKMETLISFRLGYELRNWTHPANQQLVTKLQNIIQEKEYREIKERDLDYQDQDINICLKEWSLQAQLYNFLKTEQELHSKVSFDLIVYNFKLQDYDTLINLLIQINRIHNMFSINEEKHYIEFRYNNLNYKEINNKLESRYNLLKSITNQK